jgi:hypothetical protein
LSQAAQGGMSFGELAASTAGWNNACVASPWAKFSRETFGDPFLIVHDGADFSCLHARWREQPAFVGEMLRLGLSRADPVAAQAVWYLAGSGADVSGFDGPLRNVLPRARGTFRVRVAEALFALTHSQDFAGPVCEVLTEGVPWPRKVRAALAVSGKIDAAIALNAFAPLPRVIQALARGVQDDEYLVRRHSAQTLLVLARRHTTVEKVPDLWAKIRDGSDPATRHQAAVELTRPWAGQPGV